MFAAREWVAAGKLKWESVYSNHKKTGGLDQRLANIFLKSQRVNLLGSEHQMVSAAAS